MTEINCTQIKKGFGIICGAANELEADASAIVSSVGFMPTVWMSNGNQTTTSNVLADVTDLVFSVSANSVYAIDAIIKVGCNNTGGVRFAATIPAATTMHLAYLVNQNATTTLFRSYLTTSGTESGTINAANDANGFIRFSGTVTTGVNAGSFQIQFKSVTNTQTSTFYKEGTWIKVEKLQ